MFILELVRMAGQKHSLYDDCVLRTSAKASRATDDTSRLGTEVDLLALNTPLWPQWRGVGAALAPHYVDMALHREAMCQPNPVISFSWDLPRNAGKATVLSHLLRIAQ